MAKIIDLGQWDNNTARMAIDLSAYYGQHTAPKYMQVMGLSPVARP